MHILFKGEQLMRSTPVRRSEDILPWWYGGKRSRPKHLRFRRILGSPAAIEVLENRTLLAVTPLSLVDPDQAVAYPVAGHSVSSDGQIAAFESAAPNLALGDVNAVKDVFVRDQGTGQARLVSINAAGTASGNAASSSPIVSGDGRFVVFASLASDLVTGFSPAALIQQVYRRNLGTGETEPVSLSMTGGPADRDAIPEAITPDGRFVVFVSRSTNLVTGTSIAQQNVFVRDMALDTTVLVSATNGTTLSGDAFSFDADITPDGRFVAFSSNAGNLVTQPGGIWRQIFRRDLVTNETIMMSLDTTGQAGGNGICDRPMISDDGRIVVFESSALNLVSGDANGSGLDVFARDVLAGTTILVSSDSNGANRPDPTDPTDPTKASAATAQLPVMSPDGRHVAFFTSMNLLGDTVTDDNGLYDVYVKELATGITSLASFNVSNLAAGLSPNLYEQSPPSISDDGQIVAFSTYQNTLVPQDFGTLNDVFVYDRQSGTTQLISFNSENTLAGGYHSDTPVLSSDGRYVTFLSAANNLTANDDNEDYDLFRRDRSTNQTELLSVRSLQIPFAQTANHDSDLFPDQGDQPIQAISADGNLVLFRSRATNLLDGITFPVNNPRQIYLHDRSAGTATLVTSRAVGGGIVPSNSDAGLAAVSADGRYVAFVSNATNLGFFNYNGANADVFLRDMQSGEMRLVSHEASDSTRVGTGDSGRSQPISISDDGRYVVFASSAFDLVSNWPETVDGNSRDDVFLYDRTTESMTLVSHVAGNYFSADGDSRAAVISRDGRFIVYESYAGNIVPGDNNGVIDVFLYEVATGTNVLVSRTPSGTSGNFTSSLPDLSADGRFVVFYSQASDLVPGDTNNQQDVFVFDRMSQTNVRVNVATGGGQANDRSGTASPASISADGRRVAFVSLASNLAAGDANSVADVFVRDWQSDLTKLVSVNAAGTGSGNQVSSPNLRPILSADGRFVVFSSTATDLMDGFIDGNAATSADLFLRDLDHDATRLITASGLGAASGNLPLAVSSAFRPVISADSSIVAFQSGMTDLYLADFNRGHDGAGLDVFTFETVGASTLSGGVFRDRNGNGLRDAEDPPLSNWTVFLDDGNGTFDAGEPFRLTDADGHYAFRNLLAGSYRVVQVVAGHYAQTAPAGAYTVTVRDNDSVTGLDFANQLVTADLVATDVETPAAAQAGRSVTVQWTVDNLGDAAASGSWQDAVYLSRDAVLDRFDTLLGITPRSVPLERAANYAGQLTIDVPAIPPGRYFVLVQTDRRNQVLEPDESNNMAAAAATLDVTVPELVMGQPVADAITAFGQSRYYKLTIPAGASVQLDLDSDAASGATEILVRRGALPDSGNFEFRSPPDFAPDQQLVVSGAAGVVYVQVRALFGEAAQSAFTLSASQPVLSVSRVSPNQGGAGGQVTVEVLGAEFRDGTTVALQHGADVITATAVDVRGAGRLYATFDLLDAEVVPYDLSVTNGSGSAVAAVAFEVVPKDKDGLRFSVHAPYLVRLGREAVAVVEVRNIGNVDVPTPMVILSGESANLRLPEDRDFSGDSLHFLAIPDEGPADVLRPGAVSRTTVYFVTNTFDPTAVPFAVYGVPDQRINWMDLKDDLRPDVVPVEAWDVAFPNLLADLGTTATDFRDVLVQNASYLEQLGIRTGSVSRLLSFEILQTLGSYTAGSVGTSLDAFSDAPGIPLFVTRAYQQDLAGRYTLGPLGRGWTHSWELSLETDDEGSVTIISGTSRRSFLRQHDGSLRALSGDHATLTESETGFTLRGAAGDTMFFHLSGRVAYVEDTNGNRISANHDATGRLQSLTHSNGAAIAFAYNDAGRLSSITDAAGRMTTYSYDAAGQHLLSVDEPAGMTTYSYFLSEGAEREHALAEIVFRDGTRTRFDYDPLGRLAGSSQVGGPAVALTYDQAGGVTYTNSLDESLIVKYNDAGQPERVTDTLGRASSFDYDRQGQLVQSVTPAGLASSFFHDGRGNVIRGIDASGQTTHFTYETTFNQLTELRDALDRSTNYQYDAAGNLTGIIYPSGTAEAFAFDAVGNLSQSTNRRGTAIGFTYDSRGLLTRKNFVDGTHQDFTYDARNNLLTATDAAGTTIFTYDAADRVTRIEYPAGRSLDFTYDAGGRRIRSEDQSGFIVQYEYDTAGRLAGLNDDGGSPIVSYTYDAASRLVRQDNANATFTTYSYDAAGQLTSLINHAPDNSVNSRFDYTYGLDGNRTSVTTLDGTTRYGYDALGQLVSAELPDGRTIEYHYDAVGNRMSVVDSMLGTTNYVVDAANQYTTVGSAVYLHDADGNLSSIIDGPNTTTYTWDDENRLTSVTHSATGETFAYEYDALGNRVSETINGVRTEFLYDPIGLVNLVAEYDVSGATLATYAHGLGLVSRTDAAGSGFYDFDAIGSTVGITNLAGTYENAYGYLPFGETRTLANAIQNRFTYVGQFGVTDEGNGLLRMRARSYSSVVAQFVSNDPVGLAGGDVNLRRYVGNQVTRHVDHSGRARFSPGALRTAGLLANDASLGAKVAPGGLTPETHAALNRMLSRQIQMAKLRGLKKSLEAAEKAREALMAAEARSALAAAARAAGLSGLAFAGGYLIGTGVNNFVLTQDQRDYVGAGLYNAYEAVTGQPLTDFDEIRNEELLDQILDRSSPGDNSSTTKLSSQDPNDITGPGGFGPELFVQPGGSFPYTIRFENDPHKATAPAQEVFITTILDDDVDLAAFGFGDLGFGSLVVDVPDGVRHFALSVDYTNQDGSPLRVDVSGTLDLASRTVNWTFRSLDPFTGAFPTDVFAGFLPVNDASGRGEGFVTFLVSPIAPLATGTTIDAQANIVFDTNAPLATNIHTNTTDAAGPQSSVNALAAEISSTTFTVSWTGGDDAGGSGIAGYDVFVSDNGGPFTLWQDDTAALAAAFDGVRGHTYAFYSVATDNVGHVEPRAATPDTQTRAGFNPWHHYANPYDVDGVDGVTAADVLVNVNYINAHASDPALPPPPASGPPYYDVNDDGGVTAQDVLLVINDINSHPLGLGEGESHPSPTSSETTAVAVALELIVDLAGEGGLPLDAGLGANAFVAAGRHEVGKPDVVNKTGGPLDASVKRTPAPAVPSPTKTHVSRGRGEWELVLTSPPWSELVDEVFVRMAE
jgi:RHS repeat-associated protein